MKDKLYWQVYNQKRKSYLTLKKQESRAKLKALSTTLLVQDLVSTTTPQKVVDYQVVDQASKVVDNNRSPVVDSPILTKLIRQYQTRTNYSCPPTCLYSYCNNCWYFREDELIDYKEVGM